jgi:glutamyl-tRNA synthetase/glutamyl-Q tRNA(Asp) synthetase
MVQTARKTRFAPSPTGYLHLGHVASALTVFGLGRALGAAVLLRIEDHDRGRSRPEYEAAIRADLAWLGLVADGGEPLRQSENGAAYERALARLVATQQVFACDCSRKQIQGAAADDGAAELRYGGRCRDRGLPLDAPDTGIRLVLPPERVAYHDLLMGDRVATPSAQCGDLLLRDRHGQWTYQFAVTVDDLDQGITHVVRGADLEASTARQIQLGRMLGRRADATFAHHGLLTDPAGKKLGKRFFSEAIAKRRDAGERPEELLGEAAHALGLIAAPRALAVAELPALFATAAARA